MVAFDLVAFLSASFSLTTFGLTVLAGFASADVGSFSLHGALPFGSWTRVGHLPSESGKGSGCLPSDYGLLDTYFHGDCARAVHAGASWAKLVELGKAFPKAARG